MLWKPTALNPDKYRVNTDLLSVAEARERILQGLHPVSTETTPISESLDRILSVPIHSPLDFPPFTNSSMDGFAVHSSDLVTACRETPVQLEVIEDIPAGYKPELHIASGQAARIMTGGMLPPGADAVIPLELTSAWKANFEVPGRIDCYSSIHIGENIRPAGMDFTTGELLIPAGTRLQSQHLGLLASLGIQQISVFRKPRIALLSTGSELLQPGSPLSPAKLYESNSIFLAAMLKQSGAEVVHLGIAQDNLEDVRSRLEIAYSAGADLILTSAGVSVGEYDLVRKVIQATGELNFWRVNIRPGKPLAYGHFRLIPVLGLPGNPVSSFITCLIFAIPAVQRLAGLPSSSPPYLSAVLTTPIESDGRESYLRASVHRTQDGQLEAVLVEAHQGSGNLYSLVQANALLIVPSGVKSLPSGALVKILMLTENINE